MAFKNFIINNSDGNIGSSPTIPSDKICGLLFDTSQYTDFWNNTTGEGKAIAAEFKDSVVEFNSFSEVAATGLTAYSSVSGATNTMAGIPYYHIKKFFDVAGSAGRLFVYFADCSTDWSPIAELQRAANGMISQIGVWTEQELWDTTEGSTYSLNLVSAINSVAEAMALDDFAPAHILLSANTSKVGTDNIAIDKIADSIVDARYVTVLLSQDATDVVQKMQGSLSSTTPVGTLGLALGVLTRATVGESIGWVQQFDLGGYVSDIEFGWGNITIANGKLTNSTPYLSVGDTKKEALDSKGYVFLRKYTGHDGHIYFTSDHCCSNNDYSTIARNRTANKAARLVRSVLLPYVNSPVKVDPANGNLSAAQATNYSNLISSALKIMVSAGEISAIGRVSVPVNQNILANKKLQFQYSIIPLGCAEVIEVTGGLAMSN